MSHRPPTDWYQAWGKRLLDVLLAAPLLVVALPVLVLVGGFLARQNGGQILFRQWRPGLHGRLFRLYKLQTMTSQRNAQGHLLPDAARLTHLGRCLRATSLDELPQLWNVLRGELSLVGPRPLLPEYLPLYSPEQARRHRVRPGLTGWAQVNGRNAISWEQKFAYDVWYTERVSWRLDLLILARTVRRVLGAQGITAPGQATTEAFRGAAPAAPADNSLL